MVTERSRGAERPLSWRIKERPGFTTVEFVGEIDERTDLAELRRRLRGVVVFHLGEVVRVNSAGVQKWVSFVRDLPGVSELTLTHCSPAVVAHLNMVDNFGGPASIRSFYAPYICGGCGAEESKLLDAKAQFARAAGDELPEVACPACGESMEFDDLPERYLAFLTGDRAS